MSVLREMRRRDMLALTGAALLAGCGRARAPDGLRVLVVGAGIIGASVAYHLALAGAAVTVIDREGVAARASRGTFAWLNASWAKQPRPYHGLNQRGVAGWHDLARELGIPVLFNGSIEWFGREARDARLAADILEQAEWGEPARMLARAEMEAMEPRVDFRDAARAALSPRDGASTTWSTSSVAPRAVAAARSLSVASTGSSAPSRGDSAARAASRKSTRGSIASISARSSMRAGSPHSACSAMSAASLAVRASRSNHSMEPLKTAGMPSSRARSCQPATPRWFSP